MTKAPGDTERRLQELLSRDARHAGLIGSRERGLSRTHYATQLGILHLNNYLDLIRQFEANYNGPYVPPEIRRNCREWRVEWESEIQAMLASDDRDGCLKLNRDGQICLSHYAQRFGCSSQATRFIAAVRSYKPRHTLRAPEEIRAEAIRAWLQTRFDEGELTLWNGRVERKPCLQAHGLGGGSPISRSPAVTKVFEAFDALVVETRYLPNALRDEQTHARHVVGLLEPMRHKGKRISLAEAARVSGIPKDRFRLPHLALVVQERQRALDAEIDESKTAFWIGNRLFDFEPLRSSYGLRFCSRLARAFREHYLGASSPYGPFKAIVDFLNWLACQNSAVAKRAVLAASTTGRILDVRDYREVLFAYRRVLVGALTTRSVQFVDTSIGDLRNGLNVAAEARAVPTNDLPGVSHARFLSRGRPALVDQAKAVGEADYLARARSIFSDACKAQSVDMDENDARRMFSFLEGTPRVHQAKGNAAAAILLELADIFEAIRTQCEAAVEESRSEVELGTQLLNGSTIDVAEFEGRYLVKGATRQFKRSFNLKFFPDEGGRLAEVGLANLLRLVVGLYGGVCPSRLSDPLHQVLTKLFLRAGGAPVVQRCLSPSPNALAAIMTLYLCESGSNIAVARTLNVDCLEESTLPGHKVISGLKARARGKPIICELPEDSFVVRAIEWVRDTASRLRVLAGDDADRLFVGRFQSNSKIPGTEWYRGAFRRLCAGVLSSEAQQITPAMLRPSVLLMQALRNDGRLQMGAVIGQHSEQVSKRYQQKWPTRLVYDAHLRNGQTQLETAVLSAVPEAAEALGVSIEILTERLAGLEPTGLGTFCRSIRGRAKAHEAVCGEVNCWGCNHMVMIAEVRSIAALQIWQMSLRSDQAVWERDHPERWKRVWLPWLCFANAVEEQMQRGPLMSIWEDATSLVAQRKADPNFIAPRPF